MKQRPFVHQLLWATIFSFLTSATLYDLTHKEQMPELMRYAIGGLLIFGIFISFDSEDEPAIKRLLYALATAGSGVALNRVRLEVSR